MTGLTLFRHPVLGRILWGELVSALGDGMSMVAVAWLAVQIAPPARTGVWTGLAVAAYALPAPIGAALLARWMRRLGAARLVAMDATLRAVALGTIATLAVSGTLTPTVYVLLLAISSLLHAWGSAGTYTLVAELLPPEDRITGNSLLSTFNQASYIIGPALAGGVIALIGAGWVIAVDAGSFAVLAVAASRVSGRMTVPPPSASSAGAWRSILDRPRLLGLTALTCVFFFVYGPVEVALPIHVARELHGSSSLLGFYWTVFGFGATLGALGARLLRRLPAGLVVSAIVIGWGAALMPVGLSNAVAPGLIGFGIGGLIYGPFAATTTALFQASTPPEMLSRVLAVRYALTTPSTALGTLLGGPIVGAVGGRNTLLISALFTIGAGITAAAVLGYAAVNRRRPATVDA
ncbi:MAG TPA: MFS transporter [Micromonosporaceae bacterium]